jgi:hypothetical protein
MREKSALWETLAWGALSGVAASGAYAAEMPVDIAITGNGLDDVQLMQGLLTGQKRRVPVAGMIGHLANGAALGMVYALVRRWLPGPNWVKGTSFGLLFLIAAWPLTPFADRRHPLVRRGELPPIATQVSWWQNVARHAVFGLVLGLLDRAAR